MRKLLGFVSVALLAATVAACGDSGGPVGTWTLDAGKLREAMRPKLEAQFNASKKDLDKLPPEARAMAEKAIPSLDSLIDQAFDRFKTMEMEITLESGGTASFRSKMGGEAETGKGTWKQDGEKILITQTEKNGKPATDAQKKDSPPLYFRDGALIMEAGELKFPLKRK